MLLTNLVSITNDIITSVFDELHFLLVFALIHYKCSKILNLIE